MQRLFGIFTLAVVISAAPAILETSTAARHAAVRYTANAVSLEGPRTPSGTARLDVVINRWSTGAERDACLLC
jgi:hypothetical protein